MNIYIKLFYISVFLISGSDFFGQVSITNPSLEDKPADATMPSGWFAASEDTTPDILPGYWGVYIDPQDGETYLGLITREDGSYESIGQRLEGKLVKGSCYNMSLFLAHSDNYSGYNKPLKISIYIANKKNKRQQLIFESSTITEEDWQLFNIEFYPEKNMKYIIIEAQTPDGQSSNGNILIDGMTSPQICNKA